MLSSSSNDAAPPSASARPLAAEKREQTGGDAYGPCHDFRPGPGVGYRAWTKREADIRGLSGWVCNRETGSVEAVFSGDVGAVAGMLDAVRDGPAGARVDKVEVADYGGSSGVAGTAEFIVKPTYFRGRAVTASVRQAHCFLTSSGQLIAQE